MDTRFLRSFLCIAETGSLSRAAAALDIVQPALSRQIRILEQELGTQLLVRHRRGIALTEAGKLLREHAVTIMAALEDARHAVTSAGDEPSGRLNFGLPTAILNIMSVELVAAYCKRYPLVTLNVCEAPSHVLENYLREGRLDAAILISPKPMPGVAFEPLVTENVYLAGPPGADLKMTQPVLLKTVTRLPMLVFPAHNKVGQTVDDALGRSGLAVKPFIEVEGLALTLGLIGRGLGYAMLPYCVVHAETQAGRISGAPIKGVTMSWELGIQRARAGAPAIGAMTTTLRTVMAEQLKNGAWSHRHSVKSTPARSKPTRRKT